MIEIYDHVSAEVIADSVNEKLSSRVTTFLLRYPRFIHPQMMSHRMCARNAQSSRAVPVQRMIHQVLTDPVVPIHFLSNQRGMVAGTEVTSPETARREWIRASRSAASSAQSLVDANVHKQHANRILEPFLTISAVFTFNGPWMDHFYGLRLAHDAQPEIQNLAQKMKQAQAASRPAVKKKDDWHLPFLLPNELFHIPKDEQPRCSAARCARASYLNFFGNRDAESDLQLFRRLEQDKHASPMEHVVTPVEGRYGVFDGWQSVRYHLGE